MPRSRPAAQQGTFSQFSSPPPPSLPTGFRPLFLPDLLAQAAANVDRMHAPARDAAYAVFQKWIGH
jgi:hypothetical protein